MGAQEFERSSQKLNEVAVQILVGLDETKIPRFADEMDPLNVAGEQAELDYEQIIEQRELRLERQLAEVLRLSTTAMAFGSKYRQKFHEVRRRLFHRAACRKSAMNASSSMSEGLRTLMCRTYWPLPSRSPWGSRNAEPRKKPNWT